MRDKNLPKITIVIPTKDDSKGLERCLKSIKRQDYPINKIDILVVDDGSRDDTKSIAKKYKARILDNIYKGDKVINRSEVGKAIGLHHAKGEYLYVLEQDIELVGKTFFIKMTRPLIENREISGSFAREGVPNSKMTWVTRYISYHPAQCDPMYEYFAPRVDDTVIKKGREYDLCEYEIGKIPPFGRIMYRISDVKQTPSYYWEGFFDLDSVCSLVNSGFNKFAYVHSAGIYHYHANTLHKLIYKRVRNLHFHFFPYENESLYKWFDTSTRSGVIKIILWIIYANLFIPLLLRGIYRAIKFKDLVLLADPFIAISTTDILLINFIKDKQGRSLIYKSFINLIK